MRLRVDEVGAALHPNETVVSIPTPSGDERLVVHKRALVDSTLDIGYPINEENDLYLIELPRETMSGLWRVWVERSRVTLSSRPARRSA
jgi:hypothetical protein